MASKADQYVTLRLLDAVTRGASQADREQLRRDVLGVYGITEAEAAELTTGDALEKHSKGDVNDAGQGQPVVHDDDQDNRTDAQRQADADAGDTRTDAQRQADADAEGRSGTTPAQNAERTSSSGKGAGKSS